MLLAIGILLAVWLAVFGFAWLVAGSLDDDDNDRDELDNDND